MDFMYELILKWIIAPGGGYCAHDLKFDVRPMLSVVCLSVSFALDPVFGPVKVVKSPQKCI